MPPKNPDIDEAAMTFQAEFDSEITLIVSKITTNVLYQVTGKNEDQETVLPSLVVQRRIGNLWMQSELTLEESLAVEEYLGTDKTTCFGKL